MDGSVRSFHQILRKKKRNTRITGIFEQLSLIYTLCLSHDEAGNIVVSCERSSMKKRKKRAKKKERNAIAYQNKDITSKVLADNFKGKNLEAFGLHLPSVVDVRPTNLPTIQAMELHLDNIFILADGSWSIIDYESEYSEKNKVKYLSYVAQLAKRMYNDDGKIRQIRIVVIYTADVKRGITNSVLDLGACRLTIDEAFLSDLDSAEIRDRVMGKLERGEALDDIDLMQLIIYPLTYDGLGAQQRAVSEAIDLAERISDEERAHFTLAAINVFRQDHHRERP